MSELSSNPGLDNSKNLLRDCTTVVACIKGWQGPLLIKHTHNLAMWLLFIILTRWSESRYSNLLLRETWCSWSRPGTESSLWAEAGRGEYGNLKGVMELVRIGIFWNANDNNSKHCSLYIDNTKGEQNVHPSFQSPKVFTSKIDFFCHYLLLHFAQWFWKTAWKITMLHLLNWPCRALPLEHASSQEVKRQVGQAHAENIIMKPTRICKSACSVAHLHSFSLVL